MTRDKQTSLALFLVIPYLGSMYAQDSDVRIAWDYNSYIEQTSVTVSNNSSIEKELHYPRVKQLRDGSLLMVFMNHQFGSDIFARRSDDKGTTWSEAMMVRQHYVARSTADALDKMVFATPDFIQLQDGVILLAYQWRYLKGYADLKNTNQNCGIEIVTSSDGGKTFSDRRVAYLGRCWEPSFMQLPSGEIHMYITDSNEVANGLSQPCISLLRSFDNGKTWQGKEVATYKDGEALSRTLDSRGSYDGMPVAKYLSEGNGIAMSAEVWSSRYQVDDTPVIVHSSKEKNWRYETFIRERGGPPVERKKPLHKSYRGFAPYMELLPTGEVVVQTNGMYKGKQGMWVFIGDKRGDNFSYASSPYEGHWGSIAYVGNNEVLSAGTYSYIVNDVSHRGIRLIKGRLNYARQIEKGSVDLRPLGSIATGINDLWFVGHSTESSAHFQLGYSDRSLDLMAYVLDKNLVAYTPSNSDAAEFLINRMNRASGGNDRYRLVVSASGAFTLSKEQSNSWIAVDTATTVKTTCNIQGTLNKDSDSDVGFSAKVPVPWDLLGGPPREHEIFRVHLRHRYKESLKEAPVALVESMPGEDEDRPETWLRVSFR